MRRLSPMARRSTSDWWSRRSRSSLQEIHLSLPLLTHARDTPHICNYIRLVVIGSKVKHALQEDI